LKLSVPVGSLRARLTSQYTFPATCGATSACSAIARFAQACMTKLGTTATPLPASTMAICVSR
jgi:mevalonate pyrophosphate decarboxylase